MGRVIAIVNQKGGVGKTTTAINLSAYLAHHGKQVLLVDMDPQANASSSLGVEYRKIAQGIYHPLVLGVPISDIVQSTGVDRLKLAPATVDLAGANVELVNLDKREYRLREALKNARDEHDYVIIDCPPSLGLLTINSLVASDEVLIPIQTEYLALEGLGQLLGTIDLIKQNLHEDLAILGAVMTMYDERVRLSQDVFHELYQYFPHKIFRVVVPRSTKLAEAPSFGKPILHYDKHSPGAKAYERLAHEILHFHQKTP